eukprot:6207414-Pleurochrysis_carterae.AAC.1
MMLRTLRSEPMTTFPLLKLVGPSNVRIGRRRNDAEEAHCQSQYRRRCAIGAVAFVALGDDIKRTVDAEDVADFIGAKEQRLFELVGLELNMKRLERWFLELGSARQRRTGAATATADLEQTSTINAVTWPLRFDNRRANRLAALVFCNMPQPRQF